MHIRALANSAQLANGAIHVWRLPTDALSTAVEHFGSLLSEDEKDRAEQFRFADLQNAFKVRRGALRLLLGSYLEVAPAAIRFAYGSKGKPGVATPNGLEFNVAHSAGLALLAVTMDCDIGIDVERIRPMPRLEEVSAHCFCAEEASDLMSVSPRVRDRAFFLGWTRKEAYLKAIGAGLSLEMNSFRVALRPNEPARIMHINHDLRLAQKWSLCSLELGPTHAGALAYCDVPRDTFVIPVTDSSTLINW